MNKQMDLLQSPKSDLPHEAFVYYGKNYTVPHRGDIIRVDHCSFATYYILVTAVKLEPGKNGTQYSGYALREKGSESDGVSSPAFLETRDQLEVTGKYYKINPKDRKRIIRVEISEL